MPEQMTKEQIAQRNAQEREQCIFCHIISGNRPTYKVYEDDKVIAILDIAPAAKGHVLLMPKEHYPIMPAVPEPILAHIFKIAKGISQALLKSMLVSGTNIFVTNGVYAGQQSTHFIVHIIPREQGDGVDVFSLPKNQFDKVKLGELHQALSGNLHLRLQDKLAEQGLLQEATVTEQELLDIIDANPKLKELLKANIKNIENVIEANPQLTAMFRGKDLEKVKAHILKPQEDEQLEAVNQLLKGKRAKKKSKEEAVVKKVEAEAKIEEPVEKRIKMPVEEPAEETPEEIELRRKLSMSGVTEKAKKLLEKEAMVPSQSTVEQEIEEAEVSAESLAESVSETSIPEKPIEKKAPKKKKKEAPKQHSEDEESVDLDAIANLLTGGGK
jgi:histidine triad (HIT) family protein